MAWFEANFGVIGTTIHSGPSPWCDRSGEEAFPVLRMCVCDDAQYSRAPKMVWHMQSWSHSRRKREEEEEGVSAYPAFLRRRKGKEGLDGEQRTQFSPLLLHMHTISWVFGRTSS